MSLLVGPQLAAAVARAGGLGFLAGARRTPAQVTEDFAAAEELLGSGAFRFIPQSAAALYDGDLLLRAMPVRL